MTSFYAFGILEEDYNISLSDINSELGNDKVKDYKQVKTTAILSKDKIFNRENRVAKSITKLKSVERMSIFDQEIFRSAYLDYSSTIPVHKRIRTDELKRLLDGEFNARNILTFYEFGIYNNGLAVVLRKNWGLIFKSYLIFYIFVGFYFSSQTVIVNTKLKKG